MSCDVMWCFNLWLLPSLANSSGWTILLDRRQPLGQTSTAYWNLLVACYYDKPGKKKKKGKKTPSQKTRGDISPSRAIYLSFHLSTYLPIDTILAYLYYSVFLTAWTRPGLHPPCGPA